MALAAGQTIMPAGEWTRPDGGLKPFWSQGATGLPPARSQALAVSTRSACGRQGMDQPHGLGGGGADLLALDHHLQGVAGRHEAGHALRAAGAGKQAHLDLRQPHAGSVVIGQHPVVAAQRQFERPAEAEPVDGRDPRLAAGLELAIEQRQAARALEEGLHGGLGPSAATREA